MANELSRDDLFLLMKSYENTVKSNQTLLEQQKRLLEIQNDVLKNQIKIIENTNTIVSCTNTINTELDSYAQISTEKREEIKKKLDSHDLESFKSHSNLKTKIIITSVLVGSIVISLFALIERMWTKYDSIIKLLEAISKHMGVTP